MRSFASCRTATLPLPGGDNQGFTDEIITSKLTAIAPPVVKHVLDVHEDLLRGGRALR